jgi:hypothetical protein
MWLNFPELKEVECSEMNSNCCYELNRIMLVMNCNIHFVRFIALYYIRSYYAVPKRLVYGRLFCYSTIITWYNIIMMMLIQSNEPTDLIHAIFEPHSVIGKSSACYQCKEDIISFHLSY